MNRRTFSKREEKSKMVGEGTSPSVGSGTCNEIKSFNLKSRNSLRIKYV
jgi:hypothetical protein